MSLSNISQILLRNHSLLSANSPLFINLFADGFIEQYILSNPEATISCYNTNYLDYTAIKAIPQTITTFSCEYTSNLHHDLVIINFPKSKEELAFTLSMIAPFLTENAKIFFVGEKKGGVQSTAKLTHDFLSHCQKIDAARHCLLFAGTIKETCLKQTFHLEDWFEQYQFTIDDVTLQIASLPGVFSPKKLDTGTALLLKNLPHEVKDKVLDFGCGAGVISSYIGKKYPDTMLSLLDVSALAIASAKKTLSLNNLSGNVFASNSLSKVSEKYNHIVSNPPFHQGTKTHYQATEDFLRGIKQHMFPNSQLTLVANSFLKYPAIMEKYIGKTTTWIKKQGFSIYYCQNK